MRVLLGWELGAGQGHIQRLAALAERLEAQGWQPFFALKSCNLQGFNFPWQWVAAPCPPFSGRGNSYTFADILETFGFGQTDILHNHLQNWQDMLKTIQPDLVITDHAPGLVLAARGLVPTVVVGSHFAVPPPIEVFPAFRSSVPPESVERQQRVSQTVRQLVPLEKSLGEALNGDRSFIFSIPELDVYRSYRSASPTTQYVSVHVTPLVKSTALAKPSYWSYLSREYPAYDLVVSTVKTESQFQPLQQALVDKSIAIHHGGLTTTVACLLAGVPQLILPRHIEQQLNGSALLRLGVAQMLITPTEENLLRAQAEVLSLINQAQGLANHLTHWNQNFLDRIVKSCCQLCQSSELGVAGIAVAG
jgi:UDP:flavonoid glycosyltransferase YjiC (YdhE family)